MKIFRNLDYLLNKSILHKFQVKFKYKEVLLGLRNFKYVSGRIYEKKCGATEIRTRKNNIPVYPG